MIIDEMLKAAAEKSCEIYVNQLENGYDADKQHTFSPQFKRKIKKLKRKADYPVFYRSVQRAAAILLAILICASAWLAVDVEARNAVFGWIKDVYESFLVYRFEENTQSNNVQGSYLPTWLPDGYTEFYADESAENTFVVYTNEGGEMLKFNCAPNTNETDWFVDTAETERSQVEVNGNPADLLLSTDPDVASGILWTTSDGTAFYLSAFLQEEDLIKVAESVQKKEK